MRPSGSEGRQDAGARRLMRTQLVHESITGMRRRCALENDFDAMKWENLAYYAKLHALVSGK
jgi:hypothetical protein